VRPWPEARTFGPGPGPRGLPYGCPESPRHHRETDINERRRRINPRLIAPLAFLIAFAAVALEIAYTIGKFANQTAQQIR
jgi:hypothetical protein